MIILNAAILIFVLMETANIAVLYFAPDSKLGNGVAVFNQWFLSKEDESAHLFARYMTNWVAGSKLIFIVLLLVILFVGNESTKVLAVIVMIGSIATYFWRLNPIIKTLDSKSEITPKGYSKSLFFMIVTFLVMFTTALVVYFITSI